MTCRPCSMPSRLLALLPLSLLAACGGGEPDGPVIEATPMAVATTTASPPRYLLVGQEITAANASAGGLTLRVLDPTLSTPVRTSITLAPAAWGQVHDQPMAFQQLSATSGRYLGSASLVYVSGGRMKRIDTRAGASLTPVQVSAATDLCWISVSFGSLVADGSDAAYLVQRRGSASSCDQANGGEVLVRTSMSATTAPLAPPSGGAIVDLLQTDPDGLDALLVWEPAKRLALYRPTGTRIATVSGSEGLDAPPSPMASLNGSSGFYTTGTGIGRLDWTTSAGRWRSGVFTGEIGSFTQGQGRVVFGSGRQLYALQTSSTSAVALATLSAPASQIVVGHTRIGVALGSALGDAAGALYALPLSGGTPVRLDGSTQPQQLLGQDGDTLYYAGGANPMSASVYRLPLTAGGRPVRLLQGVQSASPVLDTLVTALDPARMLGLVYCTPAVSAGSCEKGTLKQYDLATAASTVLGSVSLGVQPAFFMQQEIYAGLPFALNVANADGLLDIVLAQPSQAGSYRRVTRNLR